MQLSYAESSVNHPSPVNILLIDDDDVDRQKILRLLKRVPISCHVSEGSSAKEAIALIKHHSFQCAILDYQLQDALGSDLLELIKDHNELPVPIIMISGNSDEHVVASVMREGVFDYLPKRSLALENLHSTLQNALNWARLESTIKEQHSRIYQLTEGLPQLAWTCLPDGRCDFVNHRWSEFTGLTESVQLADIWQNVVHQDDRLRFAQTWEKCLQEGADLRINIRLRKADGAFRWFDTRATAQRNEKNAIVRWLGSSTDITEFELTRQALSASEQRFHAAFDYAPLGMALVDLEGRILQTNSSLELLLGYDLDHPKNLEKLTNINMHKISHRDDLENEKHYLLELREKELSSIQYEKRLISLDEQTIYTQVSVALIHHGNIPPCYLYQFYDLSERKRYEQQLLHLAHFDSLTGLGNRAKFYQEIKHLITKSQRSACPFAVLFGDLDNFKQINDGLGHEAGDLLLRIVARRLQLSVRSGDHVARLGGDEFVLLLQDISKIEAVVAIAEKLILRIKQPARLRKQRVHVSISFGIALFPSDGDDAQTLLRNADSALYEAKENGRGGYQLYRKELTEVVHNRLKLNADIHRALDHHEFRLHYQPIVNLRSKKICSLEALIRWQHPEQGLVPPDKFIPFAMESNLINHIGEWVIFAACQQAAIWHKQGIRVPVAINISARQFHRNTLVGLIQKALCRYSFDPRYLTLEITEQMFLDNNSGNIEQINQLKDMGVKIALDDFGTGYSSLSYIIRFAPHYLKIDRSFVDKIGTGQEQDALVKAIIDLNKIMPMTIIAEGIETQAQEVFLRNLGCELGQGYKYSRPQPPELLAPLFHSLGVADTLSHS